MTLPKLVNKIPTKVLIYLLIGSFVLIALVVSIAVLFQKRPLELWGIRLGTEQPSKNTKPKKDAGLPESVIIDQKTEGDNSPAVAGVEGDVNIRIEQKRNAQ